MEEEQKKTLCAQLGVVDDSLFFLLLIIAATLLSFWSVSLQRKGLCLTIQGETETAGQLPPIYPIRHKASAIIVGALGFFLCLALRTLEEAEEGGDCVAKRSALEQPVGVLICAAGRHAPLSGPGFCGAVPGLAGGGGTLPD
ncbi:MAG: hypothetical protein ACLSAF_06245 [Intestinimonas sp.]